MEYPIEVRIRDPLSEVTRKERRFLLGMCIICIGIIEIGIVPTKISALGVDFSPTTQKSLLMILASIVGYFLIAFSIYAASDFLAWRIAFHQAVRDSLKLRAEEEMSTDIRERTRKEKLLLDEMLILGRPNFAWASAYKPISLSRAIFDFVIPVLLGITTLCIVFSHVIKKAG